MSPLCNDLADHAAELSRLIDDYYGVDRVPPGDVGHLLMAHIIAAGLGLKLPSAKPDTELAQLQTDPLFSLVREQRELRSEAWLPFVGYTRGQAFKSASVDSAERTILRLQQQIDALAPKPAHHD